MTLSQSPHPHLQIRHRRPDVALDPFRDLAGDSDGSAPAPGEECRENLVFRGLEPNRLETGLEAFGQAGCSTPARQERHVIGVTTPELQALGRVTPPWAVESLAAICQGRRQRLGPHRLAGDTIRCARLLAERPNAESGPARPTPSRPALMSFRNFFTKAHFFLCGFGLGVE